MPDRGRFGWLTVELRVLDIRAGVEFYSRLFGRPPDFQPHRDFTEWEVSDNLWFQIAEGQPRPSYPMRFRVEDIDAECARLEREVGAHCSPLTRIPGLVAFTNFNDPWGNALGFYQRLFTETAATPRGSFHDWEPPQG